MPSLLVAGSGHIGETIGQLLATEYTGYTIILADMAPQPPHPIRLHEHLHYVSLDVRQPQSVAELVQRYQIKAIVSCLPYFLSAPMAELAKSLTLHYFDLTEDLTTAAAVARISADATTAFVPHCGIAPGFINIIAHHLMQRFKKLDVVKLRCGALPQQASNALQYALSWSIDGLINEYGNPCPAIVHGQPVWSPPLYDLETVQLDGASYEAFNTSGGLGTLIEEYTGKINHLNYKTLRYPGHCEKMLFLMNELKLNDDRDTLKKILLAAVPRTYQDVVIVDVNVQGYQQGRLIQESYFNKFYPTTIHEHTFTAIQMTTASAACAVIDLVLHDPQKYRGFIHQTQFKLSEILDNRFGEYLRTSNLNLS